MTAWWAWRVVLGMSLVLVTLVHGESAQAGLLDGSLLTKVTLPVNVHPSVLTWSLEHPLQPVPVIVETNEDNDSIIPSILGLGGTVQHDFDFIPAVDANLSLDAVVSLATNPSVLWITLDAPVVTNAGPVDVTRLASVYPTAADTPGAWAQGLTGKGVGVAIIDTGISQANNQDFVTDGVSRITAQISVSGNAITTTK